MEREQEEIRRIYAGSCEDGLAPLEGCLLELEQDPENEQALNEAFRIVHTIKGDSRMVGFEQPGELAHIIEESLDRIRKGAWRVESARITQLLAAADSLKSLIQQTLAGHEMPPETLAAMLEGPYERGARRVSMQMRQVECRGARRRKPCKS